MRLNRLAAVTLALGLACWGIALGQTTSVGSRTSEQPRPNKGMSNPLDGLGRAVDNFNSGIDKFGRKVFGKLLPRTRQKQPQRSAAAASTGRSAQRQSHKSSGTARAGSILQSSSKPTARRAATPVQWSTKSASKSTPSTRPTGTVNDQRPLHQRLASFQDSVFNPGDAKRPATGTDHRAATVPKPPPTPNLAAAPVGSDVSLSPTLAEQRPTPAQKPTPAVRPQPNLTLAAPSAPRPTGEPKVAVKAAPVVEPTPAVRPAPTVNPVRTTTPTPAPEKNNPVVDNVLFTRGGPVLEVETAGPRRITVGKESTYRVTIQNAGRVTAEGVTVLVDLPDWADMLATEATAGVAEAPVPGPAGRVLHWNVGNFEAGSRAQLLLTIVPRESRPFDLAVRWEYEPAASLATIEVQQAKLTIDLEGPRDVLYGQQELYKLHLANTGNGDAEDVIIQLLPIGPSGNQPISQNLGTLAAGKRRTIEVELTARQVGNLMIRVDVRGDGGAHAELAEEVLVRRAALQIDVAGPKVQYVGAVAAFRLRVSNPGTAVAENVAFSVTLPAGAKYVSGIDGAEASAGGNKLQWTLDRLTPGTQQEFVIQCSLGLPGPNRLDVVSSAEGDLTATGGATIQVEAVADLVLDVKDPIGPIAVGKETTYELHIRNRGSKSAENVEVAAYYSQGIEPTAAEGARHRIAPGQVVFGPISSIAAGSTTVLKIHARADEPGNHVFRTEVHCKPLGTRLVSEETTRFYLDASSMEGTPATAAAAQGAPVQVEATPLRTAERPPLEVAPLEGEQPPARSLR